jgi:hypothetical protein
MKPPIFILSSGRSGSTLLQRILNTYEDINIWGEHGGFLKDTAAAFFRLLENKGNKEYVFPVTTGSRVLTREELHQKKDPNNWQAWINFFNLEDVHAFFRQHVESFFRHPILGHEQVWGFKEVRYGAGDRVIDFLSSLYPDAVFVFISRNGYDNVVSQLKAFTGMGRFRFHLALRKVYRTCKQWSEQNRFLLQWHRSGKIRSVWIRFEDLVSSLDAMKALLALLGKEIGHQQRAVLEMENGRGSAFENSTGVRGRWKSMNWLQLAIAAMKLGATNRALGYDNPRRVRWLSGFPLRDGLILAPPQSPQPLAQG